MKFALHPGIQGTMEQWLETSNNNEHFVWLQKRFNAWGGCQEKHETSSTNRWTDGFFSFIYIYIYI